MTTSLPRLVPSAGLSAHTPTQVSSVAHHSLPPTWRDWVIALVLGVACTAELFTDPEFTWPWAQLCVTAVAFAVLPYRRAAPFWAALVAFTAEFLIQLTAGFAGEIVLSPFAHLIAGIMLMYSLCRRAEQLQVVLGLALLSSMVFLGELAEGESIVVSLSYAAFPWLPLMLLALSMRYREHLKAALHSQIRLTERNTLARELHDTVAHHVSAIAVQAQMAQFVIESQPAQAADAMKAVEETANTAIDEMRRMVGVLRSDDDRARTAPATDLAFLCRSGATPHVQLEGITNLSSMPAPIATAVYRIVQESIANATQHNRGATLIMVTTSILDGDVVLKIINDGTPTSRRAGRGYGLLGMSERVAALEGTIEAGPIEPTGWRVVVTLPLHRRT